MEYEILNRITRKSLTGKVLFEQDETCIIIQVINDGCSDQVASDRGGGNWSEFLIF